MARRSRLPAGRARTAYDPNCYLCPGNARVGGAQSGLLFDFRFRQRLRGLETGRGEGRLDIDGMGLMVAEAEPGECRVMCFSPRHDLTLATMGVDGIELVINAWVDQFRELGGLENISTCRFSRTAAP